jgi:tRNA threonylcarbamoyladenosine biosynthesis protein TsaE
VSAPDRTTDGVLEVRTSSADETRAVGEMLGRLLRAADARGEVAGLVGPLGAGKTCFVQGLARGLGAGGYVRSPTFVLVHEYPGPLPLYHVDLYRLAGADLETLALEEIMEGDGVTAIEWAPAAAALLPPDRLWIEFAFGAEEHTRVIHITAYGARSRRILEGLGACGSWQ